MTKNPQNLKPVIEYEDVSDQIKLTNEDIQGIVSLRFERDEINGETRREILQKLNWMMRIKINEKGHFESI